MLKPYDKQEDIPEALKEHYSRRDDGKFHADIPNDHPAVKHNATLLSEKQAAEEAARTAKADLESAKASGLPRGHVAIPKADADLLTEIKALGDVETIKEAVTKYPEAKQALEGVEREKVYDLAADSLGYTNKEAFKAAARAHKLVVEMKDEKENGKTVQKPYVGDKPLSEFIESTADLKALEPAFQLKGEGGTQFVKQPSGGPSNKKNEFDEIRGEMKESQKAVQPRDNASVLAALSGQPVAAT